MHLGTHRLGGRQRPQTGLAGGQLIVRWRLRPRRTGRRGVHDVGVANGGSVRGLALLGMAEDAVTSRSIRTGLGLAVACCLMIGCSNDASNDGLTGRATDLTVPTSDTTGAPTDGTTGPSADPGAGGEATTTVPTTSTVPPAGGAAPTTGGVPPTTGAQQPPATAPSDRPSVPPADPPSEPDDATDPATTTLAPSDPGATTTTEPRPADGPGSTTTVPAGAGTGPTIPADLAVLAALLPTDASSVLTLDDALLVDDPSPSAAALVNAEAGDPAWNELLGGFAALAATIGGPHELTTAILVRTTDPADGPLLLASLPTERTDAVLAESPAEVATDGATAVYLDELGNHLALLPEGVAVVGTLPGVSSVLDVSEGRAPADAGAIVPFLAALDAASDLTFVSGLPALFDDDPETDLTLRSAEVVSGTFDLDGTDIGGTMSFHMSGAAEFVETYNRLDRHTTRAADATELPLTLADPLVDDLGQVVVTVPAAPVDPTPEQLLASRNLAKKLFVGMDAYDYAEGVDDGTNLPWFEFLVLSEQDDLTPPSPGSVYIRWKFRDQAAIEAFEENELPEGFTLAPTRFLESDDPDGEYFLTLNLYNAGGDSIVSGARAEWDVFVNPPAGADPGAGERPRFMVVDVLAEEVSANAADLLTAAQPLTHELVDGDVVSTVRRLQGSREVPVFASSFPVPDPDEAEVARFTREMAIGNDYVYWAHGVSDRVRYNATTFNHDAYLVDTDELTVTDNSRWRRYLEPEVDDAVYYVNSLEYVASPMTNLDSEHLDITPEWLEELTEFANNGHQTGLMREAVDRLFRGAGDALVGIRVANETPSTSFTFEITDPDAMEAVLDLPPGHTLAPTTLFDGGDEAYYLTLTVSTVDGSMEGTRAEWSVATDDGGGRPHQMILDLMTSDLAFDPVTILNLPDLVDHQFTDGVISTRLSSPTITFEASFDTEPPTDEQLSLDWIETGDVVCRTNGICDRRYYDAETLDVPVHRPAEITITAFSTPWDDFLDTTTSVVFYRDNAQEFAVGRWSNLQVEVDELPLTALKGRTHTISGTGELIGRDTDIADSQYTYTGEAIIDDDLLNFSLDQEVDNALGVGHIYTTGTLDLTTGTGTQTVVDCLGPALLCSDIEIGSTTDLEAADIDISDIGDDTITWRIDVAVDLGSSFGTADSTSELTATPV
jgi:hypothetical protein